MCYFSDNVEHNLFNTDEDIVFYPEDEEGANDTCDRQ